ncbi:glycosyltransferase [Arthrobacter sp. NPDC056691]|uniref:glycosyltransferase n=1 Tax=Arthrobacter sp. NPDC056691 TaxID=3345913 RepID=UPI00366F584E
MTNLLIVTPMHNEEDNVRALADCLKGQSFQEFEWWAVDDASDDNTLKLLEVLQSERRLRFVTKTNDGGLIGGSAYTSWRYGVQAAIDSSRETPITHVMKLDADVRLDPDYLSRVIGSFRQQDVGLAGGVIASRGMREQNFHVPGPVKLYTIDAFRLLSVLPSAIGFDVMDEVAIQDQGLRVVVDRQAKFMLSRAIGASEGGLHGRYRNGRVCRWTGYDNAYFLLHCLRYVFRRPFALGSLWMLVGYARAGVGPYSQDLRDAHRRMQKAKLREAVGNPVSWWKKAYGTSSPAKDIQV